MSIPVRLFNYLPSVMNLAKFTQKSIKPALVNNPPTNTEVSDRGNRKHILIEVVIVRGYTSV